MASFFQSKKKKVTSVPANKTSTNSSVPSTPAASLTTAAHSLATAQTATIIPSPTTSLTPHNAQTVATDPTPVAAPCLDPFDC